MLGDVFWSRDGERELEKCSDERVACFPASKKEKKMYMYIIDLSNFRMERCRRTENCCDKRLSHILHHPTTFFCSPETKHCRFWSILLEFNKQATFFATLHILLPRKDKVQGVDSQVVGQISKY